jgi:hypothetical protein
MKKAERNWRTNVRRRNDKFFDDDIFFDGCSGQNWGQCYDFVNIGKKVQKILVDLTKNRN